MVRSMLGNPRRIHAGVVLAMALVWIGGADARPARANTCLQVNVPPYIAGDPGFVRFRGGLPHKPGSMRPAHGRLGGSEPLFGSLSIDTGYFGNEMMILLMFQMDYELGQMQLTLEPPDYVSGWASVRYHENPSFDSTNQQGSVAAVSCDGESNQ